MIPWMPVLLGGAAGLSPLLWAWLIMVVLKRRAEKRKRLLRDMESAFGDAGPLTPDPMVRYTTKQLRREVDAARIESRRLAQQIAEIGERLRSSQDVRAQTVTDQQLFYRRMAEITHRNLG